MKVLVAWCAASLLAAIVACASTTPLHERYDQSAAPSVSVSEPSIPTASASAEPPQKMCHPQPDGGEPEEIGARHVLVQWMGCRKAPETIVRTREQALAVAQEVLKRARAGDDLGRLATEYSDEPAAGSRAGSLGCFKRGTMDKRFEAAAFALKPGQLSDVVESEFGFHVIQRTE